MVTAFAILAMFSLYVDIAGSGDPLYVAEHCNRHSYVVGVLREGKMDHYFWKKKPSNI